jgi:uncharacterized membrane protein
MRASKKRRNLEPTSRTAEAESRDVVVTEQQAWSGPLPPPERLQQFDAIVENGAERIFQQWEREADHRRAYESKALRAHVRLDAMGRIMAFAFAMSTLGLAAWFATIGQSWLSALFGGGTIAAVTTALVKDHSRKRSRISN